MESLVNSNYPMVKSILSVCNKQDMLRNQHWQIGIDCIMVNYALSQMRQRQRDKEWQDAR